MGKMYTFYRIKQRKVESFLIKQEKLKKILYKTQETLDYFQNV